MGGKRYTLRESDEYTKRVERIGEVKHIDEALCILTEAISSRPEVFPIIPGFDPIRLAKTDAYMRGKITVPQLRLWFYIVDEDIVELLYIEQIVEPPF